MKGGGDCGERNEGRRGLWGERNEGRRRGDDGEREEGRGL